MTMVEHDAVGLQLMFHLPTFNHLTSCPEQGHGKSVSKMFFLLFFWTFHIQKCGAEGDIVKHWLALLPHLGTGLCFYVCSPRVIMGFPPGSLVSSSQSKRMLR